MKAIVQTDYGQPEVLKLEEIDKPEIKDNEVLARVRAACLHAGDYFCLTGHPFVVRFVLGFPKPKKFVPGLDFAGEVEEVGEKVTRFQIGDNVFGSGKGACAEFAVAPQHTLVFMPETISFEQAAAVPTSALAALHGLRDAGALQMAVLHRINPATAAKGRYPF